MIEECLEIANVTTFLSYPQFMKVMKDIDGRRIENQIDKFDLNNLTDIELLDLTELDSDDESEVASKKQDFPSQNPSA